MSNGFGFEGEIGKIEAEYTIKKMNGCKLVFGQIPLSDMASLTKGFSKKAQMDIGLADRIGATLVIGEPDKLAELRSMNLPISEERKLDGAMADALGLPEVAEWLREGNRGMSSNALCKKLFGIPKSGGMPTLETLRISNVVWNCLDRARAHDRIFKMADVSPEWAQLSNIWPDLVETFREEMKSGTKAPKTYEMMKNALGER